MKFPLFSGAALAAALFAAAPAFADGMMVNDAYARSSTPTSQSGAAFFMLMNDTGQDDRLVGVSSDVASKVELHTHIEDENGVMKMREIEGGVELPAGETHAFKRGADHIMFMGLNGPLEQGKDITVTLEFEKAGEVVVQIPVDHERKPQHGTMSH